VGRVRALGPTLGAILLSAWGTDLALVVLAGLAAINLALTGVLWRSVKLIRDAAPP